MAASVKIVNKSSTNSDKIYWICFGKTADGNAGIWSYLSFDGNGNASLNPFTVGQNCGPLFNTLDALDMFKGLPEMWSGQFLFCLGKKPKVFNIVDNGNPAVNNGVGIQPPDFNPGAPDAKRKFCTVEFTNNTTLYINSTLVDQICAPISLSITNNNNGDVAKNGILKSGDSSATIFKSLKNLGNPWKKLVVSAKINSKKTDIRAIGPQHGVDAGLIPTDYYDTYIDAIWKNYANTGTNKLTINCPTKGTFVGQTDITNNSIVFKQTGKSDVTISKPGPNLAGDIFGCVGTLNAPNNTDLGEIATILGAALNRSIVKTSGSDTQPNCNTSKFYSTANQAANMYSKVMHDNYKSGIYAFPYDDVCTTNSPLLGVTNPKRITITINK